MKTVSSQPGEDIRAELQKNLLFTALAPEALDRLIESTRIIQLEAGETLFERGDAAERFFLVVYGQIKLFRISPQGAEKVVEIMGPGDTFAEAVMFMERHVYPVSTQAMTVSRLYAISNSVYRDLLRESPDSCFRLMADMSSRLHRRLEEIDTLTLQNAASRVIRYLAAQLSDAATGPVTLELEAPKHVIASRLSMTPETFSRVLYQLSQQGLLSVVGPGLTIHDPKRLHELL